MIDQVSSVRTLLSSNVLDPIKLYLKQNLYKRNNVSVDYNKLKKGFNESPASLKV